MFEIIGCYFIRPLLIVIPARRLIDWALWNIILTCFFQLRNRKTKAVCIIVGSDFYSNGGKDGCKYGAQSLGGPYFQHPATDIIISCIPTVAGMLSLSTSDLVTVPFWASPECPLGKGQWAWKGTDNHFIHYLFFF